MDNTGLTPQQLEEQEFKFFLQEARDNFLFYLTATDPKYTVSRVHAFLAKKLQDVADGKIKRLIINCPPRVGKSRMVSIEFPTWMLGKYPDKEVIVTGYAYNFITTHSRKARAKVSDNEIYRYIFPDRTLVEGDSKLDDWAVTGGNGRYKAVGVGGDITGRGANLLIIDDPIKNIEEAHSATTLDNIWDWFLSTAYTRLDPKDGAIVIIMTRWSIDDIVGKITSPDFKKQLEDTVGIKEENEWEVINLPAIAEDNDPLGRAVGEPLYPEKFTLEKWNEIKATIGSYLWAALYCGQPVRKGGNYIKSDRIQTVTDAIDNLAWARFWDTAATEKEQSDFTASVAGALDMKNQILYLKDGFKIKAEWPAAREFIKQQAEIEKIPVGMEAVAGFKTAFQNLREVMPPYIMLSEYGVSKDKLVRALPWIAMVENFKVKFISGHRVPEYKNWIVDFLLEISSFPKGKHDDVIDAISGLYNMLVNGFTFIAPVGNSERISQALGHRQNRTIIG